MSLAERYDRWLHEWVMNPMFTWIQKLFHWNRYQLIRWALLGQVVADMLASIGLVSSQYMLVAAIYIYSALRIWQRYRLFSPALENASDAYENGRTVHLPADFIVYAKVLRMGRAGLSIGLSILGICAIIPLLLHVYIVPSLALGLYAFSGMAEIHLWDIDDIQPKDRVSLFDPQNQES